MGRPRTNPCHVCGRLLCEHPRDYAKASYYAHLTKSREQGRLRAKKARLLKQDPLNIQRRLAYAADKERHRKRLQKWREQNPGRDAEYQRLAKHSIMLEMVEAYGGKCVCCGETDPFFLTIDHIKNDGASERKELGMGPRGGKKGRAGVNFYRILKINGFPQERYRLMCFNCNCGRARNKGICPHQTKGLKMSYPPYYPPYYRYGSTQYWCSVNPGGFHRWYSINAGPFACMDCGFVSQPYWYVYSIPAPNDNKVEELEKRIKVLEDALRKASMEKLLDEKVGTPNDPTQ